MKSEKNNSQISKCHRLAQEFIQSYLISQAIEKLTHGSMSVKEIAYDLGFEYPNHFSRFFKNQTGVSPSDYKIKLNLN